MVAMVNHTAVASLHGDQHAIVASNLQEAGRGNGSLQEAGGGSLQEAGGGNLQEAGRQNGNLQERNLTGDSSWVGPGGAENATTGPHQADGPFVWETTVGWNNLTNQIYCVQEQGYVLSAYFVGYFITQVLGILFSAAH